MKKILSIVSLLIILTGCQNGSHINNSLYDGNVTKKESKQMQQSWCDYNAGRDFIKDQCK